MTSPIRNQRLTPGLHRRLLAVTILVLVLVLTLVVAVRSAQAQTYTYGVMYSFTGAPDGAGPEAGVALDAQGNLYGTTYIGGTQNQGTVFKLDTTGTETVLHSFTGTPDGEIPIDIGSLVRDAQGNLYGTTKFGGVSGNGTAFEVDSTGAEIALWSFTGLNPGMWPLGGLVLDARGNLYGTTYLGGSHRTCSNLTCGTVFKVFKAGGKFKQARLYGFTGKADGGHPAAGLALDNQGNLYGTTTYSTGHGWGTVFKVSLVAGRWTETVLYSFSGGPGTAPVGGVVLDAQGNLYGTTNGGAYGTVFKLDTTGKETELYSFTGGVDGANPQAGLVLDAQGNLFGTTVSGGDTACDPPYGCGTVFKLDSSGKKTVLHSFTGAPDGEFPYAGLVLDAQGNLYGTTFNGGLGSCNDGQAVGCGVVFKLAPR